ncbi:MAG: tryptophan synthase subunit alpha, partial [Chloroflexi bacterium]|nr:tryptophan synthase subunit alpha [Chloroflexota bacterium]
IELGIPFSDPLADGATIQRASFEALRQGVNVGKCLSVAGELRRKLDIPLLFMGYYNPILNFGLAAFGKACAQAGIDGLIVPDLPPEESGDLRVVCQENGLDLIFLLAPTSTEERIAKVGREASGFIYCVSLTGVTGARTSVPDKLGDFLSRVRRHTDLPLAVGFGISKREHIEIVTKWADGAIVGSALIDLIERLPEKERRSGVQKYIRGLKGKHTVDDG